MVGYAMLVYGNLPFCIKVFIVAVGDLRLLENCQINTSYQRVFVII